MNAEPLRDSVIVSKEETAQTSPGGIYIAHTEEKHVEGVVLAVGSGRVTMYGSIVPLELKVGDRVVFNKNFATEVKRAADVVFVLKEENVLYKLK